MQFPRDTLDMIGDSARSYLARVVREYTPYTPDVLRAGCEECEPLWQWPVARVYRYFWATLLVMYLAKHVGAWPEITSAYRCKPCNDSRDGAPQSRHLAGESGGKPFAAFDIQWPTAIQAENIWQAQDSIRRGFRQWTGTDLGIGLIIYGRRLHVDIRKHDWSGDFR